MSYDKLNEKIMDMQDEIIKAVQGCVQIDSVKAAPEEGAPYGKGCRAALDYALKLGESLGFKTGNVGNRVGYVEFGEGDEMVGVLGHLDVVPEGEGWSHDPYDMIEKDGYIYGRGVADDKGPTVVGLYALKCMKELGIQPNYTFRLVMGCSEETGMGDLPHYLEAEKMPTFAIWLAEQ